MPSRKKKGKGGKAKAKPKLTGDGASNDGGGRPTRKQWEPSPASQQQQPGLGREQTLSKLLGNLTPGATLEIQCLHGAEPALERLPPLVIGFVLEFEEALCHAVPKYSNNKMFDTKVAWWGIMDLVPTSHHPSYQNKDDCNKMATYLSYMGTTHLLDETNHYIVAAFVAHTVPYVEGTSGEWFGDSPGVVTNPLDLGSKMRDLAQGGEWEVVKSSTNEMAAHA